MSTNINASSLLIDDVDQVAKSAEWIEHEHVSEQVKIEAQKLVDFVGSSGLAKNAIDVVAQRQSTSLGNEN